MLERSAGILLPITSLYNQFPIGDLGPSAYAFVDFLSSAGLSWWQILPLGPTDEDHSPYKGLSAFAGNPLLISPEKLVDQQLLSPDDIHCVYEKMDQAINYDAATEIKNALLKKAFDNFVRSKKTFIDFQKYISQERFWLDDYVKHQEGLYSQFICWIFDTQWEDLKAYCQHKKIKIIGDIPLYVSEESPDVWAHPDIFKLDAHGKPLFYAGVPPDLFSATGQLWHVPVYDWVALRQQGYAWWLQRIAKSLKQFDLLRLDHFIGFVRAYEIPYDAHSASEGHYTQSAGPEFFEKIKKTFHALPFIAEDLGIMTHEVKQLRDDLNIPGSWVIQFDPAENCPENRVIYTATHDTDTTVGHFGAGSNWPIIQSAFSSRADLAIILMQDILGLDSSARMNYPGKKKGNWTWRLPPDALSPSLASILLSLATKTQRLNS